MVSEYDFVLYITKEDMGAFFGGMFQGRDNCVVNVLVQGGGDDYGK